MADLPLYPEDLKPGDKFPSPRTDEGIVTVVCEYGNCRHGHDRPNSVHVRGVYDFGPSEFFIALPNLPNFHVCDEFAEGMLGQPVCSKSLSATCTNRTFG